MVQAENSFSQLLRINPQSVTVLRSYAQFLLEVVNHDSKVRCYQIQQPSDIFNKLELLKACSAFLGRVQANQLLDEADRIEDVESKRHQMAAVNIVMMQECEPLDGSSETVGLITVSAKPESLGQINSFNAVALRMFGYTNRDIVGRNISTLIPEPFASVHNK